MSNELVKQINEKAKCPACEEAWGEPDVCTCLPVAPVKEATMRSHLSWFEQGARNEWRLPPRPFAYRLPIIRRFRYVWDMHRLDRWYSAVPGIRTGFDEWCLYGWWYGLSSRIREGGEANG